MRNRLFLNILMLLILVLSITAEASVVIPEPQKRIMDKNKSIIRIDGSWKIIYSGRQKSKKVPVMIEDLQAILEKQGISLPAVPQKSINAVKKRIIIGCPEQNQALNKLCREKKINLSQIPYLKSDPRYNEGYILHIESGSDSGAVIMIIAGGNAGLFYGTQTLIQMLDDESKLPCQTIIDFPDLKWRGYYADFRTFKTSAGKAIQIKLNESAVKGVLQEIKKYSAYKINRVILAGKVFDQLDQENISFLKQIFEGCRRRYIEPVPTINSLLWGKAVKSPSKNLAPFVEGVYIQDETFVFDDNGVAHPVTSTESILPNGSFEDDSDENSIPDGWRFKKENNQNRWTIGYSKSLGKNQSSVMSGNKSARLEMNSPKNYHGLSMSSVIEKGVVPNSYYELNFWSRGEFAPFTQGKLHVLQYDKNGREIKAVRNYFGFDFFAWGRFVPNWEPVFVHNECHKLKFHFAPYRRGGNKGTIYIDNVSFHRMNGALMNVLPPDESKIKITSIDGNTLFEQGRDYEIKYAPITLKPRAELKNLKSTRIQRLLDSRIAKNQKVKMSYDCLVANPLHRNSRLCPSSPGTYEFYRNTIEKLLSLSPRFINIHLSEHLGGFNRDSRCLNRNMSNAELLASFIKNINEIVQSKKTVSILPGKTIAGIGRKDVRLMMWDDMVNYWHNGGKERGDDFQIAYGGKPGPTYLALTGKALQEDLYHKDEVVTESIPKNVLIASWWYRNKDSMGILKNSPEYYENAGFDYMGSTWKNMDNIIQWSQALEKTKALGLIATCWGTDRSGIAPTADYAWKSVSKR